MKNTVILENREVGSQPGTVGIVVTDVHYHVTGSATLVSSDTWYLLWNFT